MSARVLKPKRKRTVVADVDLVVHTPVEPVIERRNYLKNNFPQTQFSLIVYMGIASI